MAALKIYFYFLLRVESFNIIYPSIDFLPLSADIIMMKVTIKCPTSVELQTGDVAGDQDHGSKYSQET